MAIEVNFNNKNKHWVIIILDRIKSCIEVLWSFIIKCLRYIGSLFKRIWKYIVGGIAFILVIILLTIAYNFYKDYRYNKKLDEVVTDITNNFHNGIDSDERLNLAYDILDPEHEWVYPDIKSWHIRDHIDFLRSEAFDYLEHQSDSGNEKAQYLLGGAYYNLYKDNDKAAFWWNESANNGCVRAYNNIGICYRDGIGVIKDQQKAFDLFKKGAEEGEAWAQLHLGEMYRDGVMIPNGTRKDTKIIWDEDGNFAGAIPIDVPNYKIWKPKDNIVKAQYWWRKSAAQGNEKAKDLLQKIYN